MVDRPQTKLLLVFLTALVSLSVMSISALATPQFKMTGGNFSYLSTNESYVTIKNLGNQTYNASNIYSFAINITHNATAATTDFYNISNVTWTFAYQNLTANNSDGTYNRSLNFTFYSSGRLLNGSGTNVTFMGNDTGGMWWINISQTELGAAGNWNLTIRTYNTTDALAVGGGLGNSTTVTFYVPQHPINLSIMLNGTNGNRTYNFVNNENMIFNISAHENRTSTLSNATNSRVTTNATREIIYIGLNTNISGWKMLNFTNIQGDSGLNITSIPQLSNRSYNATVFLNPGNVNFTASNVTVIITANDNENPNVNILKPTGGSAFTEATVIFKANAGDNVAGTTGCDYKINTGNFKTLSQGVDITLSDLNSGDHTITVQCTDPSSNKAESKVKFSITLLPSAPGGPGTTSTISVPVVSTPSEGKTQVFIAKVSAGKEAIAEIKTGDVASISITVKNDVTSVYVTVNKLDAKPADVTEAPGKIFRYLDIKPSGLPESSIDKAKIKFKVEKQWITANNANADKMYLNRFANSVWNRLSTTKVLEGTDIITYEAETPGFSVFAISFEEAAPSVPSTVPAPTPTPKPTPTPAPTPTPTVPGAGGDVLPIIAIVVVVIIIAVVLVRAGVI